jgi:hypothetical protein
VGRSVVDPQNAEKEVPGVDAVVPEQAGLVLCEDDDLASAVGEPFVDDYQLPLCARLALRTAKWTREPN